MSTFQTIVYGIIHGLTRFAPVGTSAHEYLIQHWLGWPSPPEVMQTAYGFAAFLALLIVFRHDWASIAACFLQVVIFRKKPMILDERLPFFLSLTAIPSIGLWYYLNSHASESSFNALTLGLLTAAFAFPLWMSDRWSRKNKGMFDWNLRDALTVGITQASMFAPGGDMMTGAIPGAFVRNYNREAATKYALFATAPILLGISWRFFREIDFHSAQPATDLSWLSLGVGSLVTLFFATIALGGVMRYTQKRGFGAYAGYRLVVAMALLVLYWMKER